MRKPDGKIGALATRCDTVGLWRDRLRNSTIGVCLTRGRSDYLVRSSCCSPRWLRGGPGARFLSTELSTTRWSEPSVRIGRRTQTRSTSIVVASALRVEPVRLAWRRPIAPRASAWRARVQRRAARMASRTGASRTSTAVKLALPGAAPAETSATSTTTATAFAVRTELALPPRAVMGSGTERSRIWTAEALAASPVR
jgi:hypothetical protein